MLKGIKILFFCWVNVLKKFISEVFSVRLFKYYKICVYIKLLLVMRIWKFYLVVLYLCFLLYCLMIFKCIEFNFYVVKIVMINDVLVNFNYNNVNF